MKKVSNFWRPAPRFTDDNHTYSRIAGGIGWPAHGKPGWVCVIGEEASDSSILGTKDLHVLAEGDSAFGEPCMDPVVVFKAMSEQVVENMATTWYGLPTYPKTELAQYNRSMMLLKQPRLRILPPPQEEQRGIAGLLQLVRRRVSSHKSLFFGEHQRIPSQLSALPADIDSLKYSEHPAVTALLMAVAGLDLTREQVFRDCGPSSGDVHAGY
jgi:hypothetical protein